MTDEQSIEAWLTCVQSTTSKVKFIPDIQKRPGVRRRDCALLDKATH